MTGRGAQKPPAGRQLSGVDPWSVLDAVSDCLAVLDRDGQVRYLNAAWATLGVSGAFRVGRDYAAACTALFDEGPATSQLTRGVRDVLAGRSEHFRIESHTREAAPRRWFAVVVRRCEVEGGHGALIQQRDITETKHAEAALRESEERFRTLVDGSPDIVFITDASSRMIYANAALEEQTDYTVDDFQIPQEDNRFIHPDDQERVAAFIADFVASGRKYSGRLENRFVARGGEVLWYSSVISRCEYEGKPALQFVVHNITEQRWAREELARAQLQLIRRERLAALGELAAVVAHEVRNPLTVIFNSLSTLRKRREIDEASRVLFGILDEEATRLQRIVSELLDFSRPIEPSFEPSEVVPLVKEAFDAAAAAQPDPSGVDVVWAIEADVPPIPLDAHLTRQALVNLLSNAFQAMPKGGRLTLAVRRSMHEAHDFIEISVSDTGLGITPDVLDHIFEPFFTTRAMGTGLGLALVKRIVDVHRGHVDVRTSAEGGATFVVGLPVSAANVDRPTLPMK